MWFIRTSSNCLPVFWGTRVVYHVVRAPQHDYHSVVHPSSFSALESVAQRNGARWTRRRSSRWTRRRAHRSWSASGAAINRVFSDQSVRPAVLGSGGLPGRRGPCMWTESGRRDTAGATSGVRSTVWYVYVVRVACDMYLRRPCCAAC